MRQPEVFSPQRHGKHLDPRVYQGRTRVEREEKEGYLHSRTLLCVPTTYHSVYPGAHVRTTAVVSS